MSDDSTAPADLSNIGIDLTQMFRPAWTTETTDTSARLAAKFDEGDRPERRGGDRGRDRHQVRDSRGPRPERGAGGLSGPGGPRPEGRREGPGQGGRSGGPRREGRPSGRDRNDRGGSRDREERRPEPATKPLLEGWNLQLIPEAPAIEGIAKQIRSRAKAYPLFELARLIVQLSDRYSVKLAADPEKTAELFRAKLDDSLWTSRKEAVNHLLSKHLGKFYRSTSVTTEAPKGAFAVVAQCGMSGILLGPPNHHEYTTRLIALHSSRFKNMPFEIYKSRIRMMRDEALIEQWKTEQSTKTIYIPLTPGEAPTEEVPTAAPETPASEIDSTLPAAEVVSTEETVTVEEIAEEVPGEMAPEVPAEPAVEPFEAASTPSTDEIPEGTETAAPSSSEETAAEVPSETSEGGLSLEQANAHFHEHHAANEVESVGKEIMLEGRVALHGSTPLLRELLLKNLQEMDHFPLPLAQIVGKELTNRGLQLFKSHKKIINVSVARPRYLDRETSVIGEGFRSILEYLEAHPKQHRDKQWAALLALRTETSASASADPTASITPEVEPAAITSEAVASVEANDPSVAVEQTTEARKEKAAAQSAPTIDEETLKRREQALGTDLLWLLHQGHVIDFAMGNLQAATRPVPKTPPAPKKKEKTDLQSAGAASTDATDLTLAGDTDEALQGGAATESAEAQEDVINEPAEHHEPLEIPAGTILKSSPPVDPGQALPS